MTILSHYYRQCHLFCLQLRSTKMYFCDNILSTWLQITSVAYWSAQYFCKSAPIPRAVRPENEEHG